MVVEVWERGCVSTAEAGALRWHLHRGAHVGEPGVKLVWSHGLDVNDERPSATAGAWSQCCVHVISATLYTCTPVSSSHVGTDAAWFIIRIMTCSLVYVSTLVVSASEC